jgi:hypothetical protein
MGYLKIHLFWDCQVLEVGLKVVSAFGLPMVCAFWHVHTFYPFPHSIVIYPASLSFLISWPQADTQASGQD